MKGVVQIGEVIDEYMERLIGKERIRMAAAWPGIAGSQLYGVTEFWKVENGVLYLRVRSPSARNLVNLRSSRIIRDFNEAFPDNPIKSIRTSRIS